MEKIWIAGAKGHVGSALCDLLDCRHYEILPTDLEEVDITDRESVSNYVRVSRPDVLINCVGFGDIASCEAQPDKAYQVNTVGARNLAVQAQAIGAKLIHLSTDDVFSHHARQPYNEFEIPTPSTIYGKSKLAGERFVQNLCTRHVIVRSSWVYGIGRDFVNTILEAANNPSVTSMEVAENEFASPTSATELAKVIEQLIDNDCLGIYHAVCVVLASDGYPVKYDKGFVIRGLDKFKDKDGYYVFHAGSKRTEEGIVTNGGRVLGVTAKGKDLKEARANAYAAVEWIDFENKYYRHDIGKAIDEA